MAAQETDWAQIAAWVFGCWSVMIPIGVGMVRSVVREGIRSQEEFQKSFHIYVLDMERRMVLVEERLTEIRRNSHGVPPDPPMPLRGWRHE